MNNESFDIRSNDIPISNNPLTENNNDQKIQVEDLLKQLAYHQERAREIKKQLENMSFGQVHNHPFSLLNLNETPHAYLFLDKSGKIIETNYRFAKILNSTPELLEGLLFQNLLIPESRETFLNMNSGDQDLERSLVLETKLLKDNGTLPVRLYYSPDFSMVLGNKNLKQWAVFDISQEHDVKKKLDTNERVLSRFMENFPGMVFIIDQNGRLVKTNHVFDTIMGKTNEELIGNHSLDFIPEEKREIIKNEDQKVLRENKVLQVEHVFNISQNPRTWLTLKFPIHLDENNTHMGALSLDITERKAAFEEVKNQNAIFANIERINSLGIAEIEIESEIVTLSKNLQNILGIDQDNLSILEVFSYLHPDDRHMAQDKFLEAIYQSLPFDVYHRIIRKDNGQIRHLRTAGDTITNEDGKVIKIFLFSMDISDRLMAEEALRRSEERYRTLVETSPEAIILLQDEKLTFANQAVAEMIGAESPDDLLGENIYNYIHPDYFDKIKNLGKNIHNGQKNDKSILKFVRPDGTNLILESISVPIMINKIPTILAFGIDITKEMEAREELRKRENLLQKVFEVLPIGMWLTDEKGNIISGNPAGKEIWGAEPEFIQNGSCNILLKNLSSGKTIDRVDQMVKQFILERETCDNVLFEISSADGVLRTVLCHIAPVLDDSDNVEGALIVNNDISKLKVFETQLNTKINELQTLFSISTIIRKENARNIVLENILKQTLMVFNAKAGIIWSYDKNSNQLLLEISSGLPEELKNKSIRLSNNNKTKSLTLNETELSEYLKNFISEDADFITHLNLHNWQQSNFVILSSSEIFGIFQIFKSSKTPITKDEKKLLNSIAEMTGTALHRLKLYDEINQRLAYMKMVQVIDKAITSNTDLKITLEILLAQIEDHFYIPASVISLIDYSMTNLKCFVCKGLETNINKIKDIRLGYGLIGNSVINNEVLLYDMQNGIDEHLERKNLMQVEGFSTLICLPIKIKGEIKGILEIFLKEFDRSALQVLKHSIDDLITDLKPLAAQAGIAIENSQLFQNLQTTNMSLKVAYDSTIEGWSKALDLRDKETEGHSQRVTQLTTYLASRLGFSGDALKNIHYGALLHDIGKMGIPDNILLKPAALTEEEWLIMRKHPELAYNLLYSIPYLRNALDIPYCHHEKWDGSGYPRGLKGGQIPLAARIFALVDVWDALSSDRPYRPAWSKEKILAHMQEQSGIHFDPEILKLFLDELKNTDNFSKIFSL